MLPDRDVVYLRSRLKDMAAETLSDQGFHDECEWRWNVAINENRMCEEYKAFPFVSSVDGSSIASFPLRIAHSVKYARDRVAFIGYGVELNSYCGCSAMRRMWFIL